MKSISHKPLHLCSLALLITGSIDSIRNLPATALFGTDLLFFFLLASLFFLIPVALVSAELAAGSSEQGGIFHWVHQAFGKQLGFLAVWLQWVNTLVWYPTILSFIAGTAVYLIVPALAENKYYLISVILGVFWLLTIINMKGIKISARIASISAIVGMLIPMILIICLGIYWIVSGQHLQLQITASHFIPQLSSASSWVSVTAVITSFLGMELATVHVKEVHNPQKTFPRAMLLSVFLILVTMLFGALTIAVVLPHNQINLVNGVIQTFISLFHVYHLNWLMPVMTVLLLIGSIGSMINWIIAPAKGLLQAAEQGFLPTFLCQVNRHQIPVRLLLLQAIIVSLVCLAFLIMPSVNGSYWLLTDLSTQLYMLMYVLMFLAAIVIRHQNLPKPQIAFQIPGGIYGFYIACCTGLVGCAITLVVGFIPPQTIDVGGFWHYESLFIFGMVIMVLPTFFLCKNKRLFASQAIVGS